MLNWIRDRFFEYLKNKPYWPVIEPFVLLLLVWGAAQLLAYRWHEHSLGQLAALAPPGSGTSTIGLFLGGSYVSKRITITALGIVAIMLMTKLRRRSDLATTAGHLGAYWQAHRTVIVYRTLGIALIGAAVALGFRAYSPNRVLPITVRFMSLDSEATPEGVAYLVYELNRRQGHWYFDVDFRPFTEEMLTSEQANRCGSGERPRLCHAEALAGNQPFIGIVAETLGGAYFAEHRGSVSVISTFDRVAYQPLSTYEYLAHGLILQGILIHLDLRGGLPPGVMEEDRISHGGLFQFIPEKQALKSSILAARLSPDDEALLLNRFGSDYVATLASLLTMDWLYSERVRGNLERVFNAKFGR